MNILITGVTSGVGYELLSFFEKDPNVNLIIGVGRKGFDKQKLFSKLQYYKCDLGKLNEVGEFCETISSKEIVVDKLVLNAGSLHCKPFTQLTQSQIFEMTSVNYLSNIYIIQSLISSLKRSTSAHVVTIGTIGGVQGSLKFSGLSVYSSSKSSMAVLMECLAEEYKDSGICFNYLALGSVETKMFKSAFPEFKAQFKVYDMASYIYGFAMNSQKMMNGKIISLSLSSP